MWSNKKRDTPQAADSEPTNLQTNQPTKVTPAFWERTPKMNNDAIRTSRATADRAPSRLGSSLHVKGDIIAGEVIVYGSVKGNVRGRGKIEIKKDGSVNGDLTTAQIIIEDGAYFKGSIEIERSAEKEGDKNVFSRAASAPATPAAGAEPRSI